jgi:hypothetical protein
MIGHYFPKAGRIVPIPAEESITTGLTGWSSRRPQAPLAGALRASHCGAAYRER